MNFSHAHQQVSPRLSRSMEDLDSILDRLKITLDSTPETRSSPIGQDTFLKTIDNGRWEMYREEDAKTPKIYFYCPTTGEKRLKPPRKGQKVAQIPRTLKSVPSYGSLGNHTTTTHQHPKSTLVYPYKLHRCTRGSRLSPLGQIFGIVPPPSNSSLHSAHVWYIAQESSITCMYHLFLQQAYILRKEKWFGHRRDLFCWPYQRLEMAATSR